jgi:hypothetical protein
VSEIVIGEEELEPVVPEEDVTVKVETAAPPVAPAVNGTDTFAEPVYD